MKIYMFLFILGIFLTGIVGAEVQTLGTFKQWDAIDLVQVCSNCSYNNITTVRYPNNTVAISDVVMAKNGTEYNYRFHLTRENGRYIVNGFGDLDGVSTAWNYDFYINPAGREAFSILDNSLLLMLALIGLTCLIFGVATKNPYIGFIGGIMFMLTGIYTTIYGFDDLVNLYTRGAGWTFIGLGLFFSIVSSYEWVFEEDED